MALNQLQSKIFCQRCALLRVFKIDQGVAVVSSAYHRAGFLPAPPVRSRHKPISLPTMATTTTNLASRTACRRRHAGITERPARPTCTPHCCHVTTSTPRTRPLLPASSTPALPRRLPPPRAHGQPSRAGARPAGRLTGQPCCASARKHRAASHAAKPPPLSAPSHHLHTQPPLAARSRRSRHRVEAAATHSSPGVDPAPCHRPRA
jgi:hypothetical protein